MIAKPSVRKIRHGGAVVTLTAMLMVVIVGMVAFSVDIGYIAVTRAELQNAADSAALAGAWKLFDRDELSGLPSQSPEISAARAEAVKFAGKNKAGNIALVLDRNDGNSPDGDIVIGHMANPTNSGSEINVAVHPYNAVKVRIHRDHVRNGSLNLFFAGVLGKQTQELEATATACFEDAIKGFRIRDTGPQACKLLPYALDVNVWMDQIVNRNGADEWQYDPNTKAYSPGSDGIPEVKLFPNKGIAPGNFGTIDIGSPGNGTSELARQILYGPNKSDLAYYPGGEFKLGLAGVLITGGDTGISAGVKDELASIRGQPRIIPLYQPPVVGSGNNAKYTLVGFAGVIITEVVLTGAQSKKHITIQPEFVIDGTAIGGGSSTTSYFVYRSVALVR